MDGNSRIITCSRVSIIFLFTSGHPYSPQERGSNERLNRRLRESFPKKTDFSKVSQGEVFDAVDSINKRHLKVLNWETADEVFHDELFKLKTGSD